MARRTPVAKGARSQRKPQAKNSAARARNDSPRATNKRGRPEAKSAAQAVRVLGTGFHFPEHSVPSAALIRWERPGLFTIGQQIRANIGCDHVYIAGPNDTPSSLTVAAARRALDDARLEPSDIDLILTIACTPADFDMWSLPAKVAKLLGANQAECFAVGDVGCAGAFAALRTAVPLMLAPDGPARVLIAVGHINPGHYFFPPATIFGDGAGAAVLERVAVSSAAKTSKGERPSPRIVRADLYSFSHLIDSYNGGGGLNLLRKEGRLERTWWSFAIRDQELYNDLRTTNFDLGAESARRSLSKVGWDPTELRWFVADNVSAKVGLEVATRLGVPYAHVLTENCRRYGHAFTADLFVNLSTLLSQHPLEPGDRIACVGMGIGQHWGVLLLEA